MNRCRAFSRFHMEILEPRVTPSITWVGSSGDWDTPGNWSSGNVPGAGDDVVINVAGISVTHKESNADSVHSLTSQDPILMSAGSLAIGADSTLSGAMSVKNSTLSTSAKVTLNGSLDWTYGTLSGSGVINANGGMTVDDLAGGGEALSGVTLNNNGDFNWMEGTIGGGFLLENGAVLNNDAGATINARNSRLDANISEISNGGGTPSALNNLGTFMVAGGTNSYSVSMDVLFNNSGTISLSGGTTLDIRGGGTHGGKFIVPALSTLQFDSDNTLSISSSIAAAGTVTFTSGTISEAGSYDVTGFTIVAGGTVTFSNPITSLGNPLQIKSGTAVFDTGSPISVSELDLAGTLDGTDPITVTQVLDWTGGTMAGDSTTTLVPGTIVTLGGQIDGRTLINEAFVTDDTGVEFSNGGVLDNVAGATWSIEQDALYDSLDGTGTFNNAGTLVVSSGPGILQSFNFDFNNGGLMQIQSGALSLTGGSDDTGRFMVPAGTTLDFEGTATLEPGSSVSGTGTFSVSGSSFSTGFGGAVFEAGSYNVSGTTVVGNGFTLHFYRSGHGPRPGAFRLMVPPSNSQPDLPSACRFSGSGRRPGRHRSSHRDRSARIFGRRECSPPRQRRLLQRQP